MSSSLKILALLLAGYYGALSDRKGRRFVMQISMVGGILSHATTLLTLKYYNFFDVYLLFFGPVLRGFLAGEAILIATANAYLSDCTTIANRTLMFGRMIASIYLGTTLGRFYYHYQQQFKQVFFFLGIQDLRLVRF